MKLKLKLALASLASFASLTLAIALPILSPTPAHAQNCTSVVTVDEAGVLGGSKSSVIQQAAQKLIDQGVDPHVITIADLNGGSVASGVQRYITACGWRADTAFEPNLLLLVVATKDHKKNAFFGSAIAPALKNAGNVDYLYSTAANPYFKSHDFAGGFAAAFRDFGGAISAYHDQAKHPQVSQTVVNNQATDFHGFWIFLGWLLALGAAGGILILVISLFRRRKESEGEIKDAQGIAIDARTRATNAYNNLNLATGAQNKLFADLSNSIKNDPTADGLSVAEYNRIASAWNEFYTSVTPCAETSSASLPEPEPDDLSMRAAEQIRRHHAAQRSTSDRLNTPYGTAPIVSTPITPTPITPTSTPTPPPTSTTTIIHEHDESGSGNDGLLTGLVVGDMLGERNSRSERYSRDDDSTGYSSAEPHETRSTRSTRSDDDDDTPASSLSSGDDSSWSSSSDSSSSSSSSDSSDSFDSSSSGDDSSFGSSSDDSSSSSGDDSSF